MLFDLRGRGRRRVVRVIYLSLAILMGGGLVFFGIGGSVSGGLFDAIGLTNSSGGGGGNISDTFKKNEQAAQKRVTVSPRDPAAWAALVRAQYQRAGQGDSYDQNAQVFTAKGRQTLAKVARNWERYLALKPKRVDPDLAALMVQTYGPAGLNKFDKATEAAELIAQATPTAEAYTRLATFAYAAGQSRKGDLAAAKAISLTPKDQRATLKGQLDQAKAQRVTAGQGTTGG